MWKQIIKYSTISVLALYLLFQVGYYATSVPSFCASCHEVSKYVESWRTSPHNGMNCPECHQPRGELGKFHAKARGLNYVFQHMSSDYTIPTGAMVFEKNCIQCHLGDDKDYPNAAAFINTPQINHYDIIKSSRSCLECHRQAGHAIDIYLRPDLKGIR